MGDVINAQMVAQASAPQISSVAQAGNVIKEGGDTLAGINNIVTQVSGIISKIAEMQKYKLIAQGVNPEKVNQSIVDNPKVITETKEVVKNMKPKFNKTAFLTDLSKALDNANKLAPANIKELKLSQILDPNFSIDVPMLGKLNQDGLKAIITEYLNNNFERYLSYE